MRISDWSSDVCSSDLIADRLYVRAADLPEGEVRVPLKEIHLNRCPALIQWEHLREPDFQRLAIDPAVVEARAARLRRSEEHTSELQSLTRISYAVFCLKKKKHHLNLQTRQRQITP